MNFQQDHRQQITIFLLILQILTTNKRCQNVQMQRIFNIYNLLTFNYVIMNSVILFIYSSPSNTRIHRQPRPKTNGFWTDVFPFLVDDDSHNSSQKHFHITLATFCTIVTRLETHPAFILILLMQHLYGNRLLLYIITNFIIKGYILLHILQ